MHTSFFFQYKDKKKTYFLYLEKFQDILFSILMLQICTNNTLTEPSSFLVYRTCLGKNEPCAITLVVRVACRLIMRISSIKIIREKKIESQLSIDSITNYCLEKQPLKLKCKTVTMILKYVLI